MIKSSVISSSGSSDRSLERQNLLTSLMEAVKSCQRKFGGRPELATESDKSVANLCKCWEDVLSHGLRTKPQTKNYSAIEQITGIVTNTFKPSQEHTCFWHFVGICLTRHELNRYISLKNVWTDIGRGRAWLRSSLNERSLERYLHILFANRENALVYYHEWALLLDEELNSTLPNMAAGLGSILFANAVDDGQLNKDMSAVEVLPHLKSEPILTIPGEEIVAHPRRRKKGPAHIVSFDSDGDTANPQTTSVLSSSAESTNIHVTTVDNATQVYCEADADKSVIPSSINSPSPSSNDSSLHDFENLQKHSERIESVSTLTPVNDGNVGELMLISTEELPGDDVSMCDGDDLSVETLLSKRGTEDVKQVEVIEQVFGALEQLQEANAGLRTKLKNTVTRHKTETSNTESRLLTLTRENEVLKHQLRKYVSAVQMLNRDGAAHEALAYLEASQSAAAHREEAAKYQEQLVQVAQMHGELMEFNERLQRQLISREEVIMRLERELTDLRGPLPAGSIWDADNSPPVPDALVNIWIPSAFLTSGSSGVHHLYQVYIRIRDTEWNIYRRYAQFHALHGQLKKQFPVVATLDFPPKKTIGYKDAKFVEERRQRLQRYLRQAVDVVSRARPDMSDPVSLVAAIPFFSQTAASENTKPKQSKGTKKRVSDLLSSAQYNGL